MYFLRPFTLAVLLMAFCLNNLAFSTESAGDDADRQLRDKAVQDELDEALRLSKPSIQLPEVAPLPEVVEEEVCFVIEQIKVEGLLSHWAHEQGLSYLGQCVGFTSIQSYVRLINQKLLADGYITSRAFLPEQNLSEGSLEVIIQEGIIDEIRFPNDYRFYSNLAIPLKVGKVLNLRDMEQAVDQLSRLQSHDVEFKVQPGLSPNSSVLVAEVTQTKPWKINLSTDDSGSDATGNYPLTLSATIDNVIGLQDSLTYSQTWARADDNIGESNSRSLTWSLPLGYGLMTYTLSQSNYLQFTQGDVQEFSLGGNSDDQRVVYDYVAFRNNKSKTTFSSTLKTRARRSYLDDALIEVQSRDLTELKLTGAYRRYVQNGVFDVSFNIHQGVPWLGAEEVDSDASSDTAQPDYRFYSVSASFSKSLSLLSKNVSYVGQAYIQYADSTLYSLDWFSNGGRYTVRGFSSDESVSEESGWRVKNDVSLPLSMKGYSFTPYIGLDAGQVYGDTEEESGKTLMGIAFGIKGQLFELGYDIFAATPFVAYGPYASSSSHNVNASLSAQF